MKMGAGFCSLYRGWLYQGLNVIMKVDIWLSYGEKKWWINNPYALALRGNCFDDFLKILFEYGYDSYFCQVLIQKSRLPLTYTSWYHNIFIAFL